MARHLGVSWNLVKTIVKAELQRRFGRPHLGDLKRIAIGEISIGRGHRYLTVVLDLESVSRAVVFVGEGKGSDALDPFWQRLRRAGAEVRSCGHRHGSSLPPWRIDVALLLRTRMIARARNHKQLRLKHDPTAASAG